MYYILLNRIISDNIDRNMKKKCDTFHYEFGKKMTSLIIKNEHNTKLNDKDRLNYYVDLKHFMKYYNDNCSIN